MSLCIQIIIMSSPSCFTPPLGVTILNRHKELSYRKIFSQWQFYSGSLNQHKTEGQRQSNFLQQLDISIVTAQKPEGAPAYCTHVSTCQHVIFNMHKLHSQTCMSNLHGTCSAAVVDIVGQEKKSQQYLRGRNRLVYVASELKWPPSVYSQCYQYEAKGLWQQRS